MSEYVKTDDRGREVLCHVGRGRCGWCNQPFMRPMESVIAHHVYPVLYCRVRCRKNAAVKRRRIRDNAYRCRHPEKMKFLTEVVAQAEIDRRGDRYADAVAYLCPGCWAWHIGHLPEMETT